MARRLWRLAAGSTFGLGQDAAHDCRSCAWSFPRLFRAACQRDVNALRPHRVAPHLVGAWPSLSDESAGFVVMAETAWQAR